ncbi:alpha/beta hydrolase [Lacisediminihabitans profunda]|uniref:Alpha/beta fold hydrolase n=1 Tax=Lacisediminihabitans profunda TaxID=2594790 RepID=A0A5C8UU49_9MICO|nr:dienelactone hydrolase family protein [Lacisediminihabitans profunda]TXN31473.1 alpha/beta fold hydrolase [Lacisediminihabitans profunda]
MSSSFAIDPSAVVWSVPEAERVQALASRPLLVLLHGRGSHENDLFALAPLLPSQAVIASVRAPLALGDGFSWFPVGEPGLPSLVAADAAVSAVLEWLDTVPAMGPVGLLGFSQGGAMTLHLARHAPERFAAFVNLAGFVIQGEAPADERLEVLRPPVFWGRDAADPVIPQSAIERTVAWLPSHSTLTTRLYSGIGHSISRDELDDVNEFLAANLR